MLGIRIRWPRPAPGFRRRSFLFGAVAALGFASFFLATWPDQTLAAAGSTRFDPETARRVVRRWLAETRAANTATSASAAEPVRVHLRRVESSLGEAERITGVERRARRWNRTPGRVEEAWYRAARATYEAAAELRARHDRAAGRWAELSERLAVEIQDARQLLASGGGLGYREARAMRTALYHRDAAMRHAGHGDLERAVKEAEQALLFGALVEDGFASLHSRFHDPRRLREWRAWAQEAIAASKSAESAAIVVDKLDRRVQVYQRGLLVATFHAELGANGLKEKRHAGDKATPEGRYKVTETRHNGQTRYYKALMLDYPNAADRARFEKERRLGLLPPRVGLGGLIEIHGEGGTGRDWTDGCVALTNRDMDRLFRWSRVGTPVTIVGTL